MLSGPQGARLLDPTDVRHGLRGRFLRWRQGYGYERQGVLDVLRARGGHHLLHSRRWTIEEIPWPRDHHGERDG